MKSSKVKTKKDAWIKNLATDYAIASAEQAVIRAAQKWESADDKHEQYVYVWQRDRLFKAVRRLNKLRGSK